MGGAGGAGAKEPRLVPGSVNALLKGGNKKAPTRKSE
jgi:hypothetical protein